MNHVCFPLFYGLHSVGLYKIHYSECLVPHKINLLKVQRCISICVHVDCLSFCLGAYFLYHKMHVELLYIHKTTINKSDIF